MPAIKHKVNLSDDERQILQTGVQKGKNAARSQTRARILLKASEGSRDKDIIDALNVFAIAGGKNVTAMRLMSITTGHYACWRTK